MLDQSPRRTFGLARSWEVRLRRKLLRGSSYDASNMSPTIWDTAPRELAAVLGPSRDDPWNPVHLRCESKPQKWSKLELYAEYPVLTEEAVSNRFFRRLPRLLYKKETGLQISLTACFCLHGVHLWASSITPSTLTDFLARIIRWMQMPAGQCTVRLSASRKPAIDRGSGKGPIAIAMLMAF